MRHCMLLFVTGVVSLVLFAAPAESQAKKKKAKTPIWSDQQDAFGDPLPIGAIARIGTTRYRLPEGRQPSGALLSPDGKLLAALSFSESIDLWNLPAWTKHSRINTRTLQKGGGSAFQGLAFTSDSKTLLTCDTEKLQIHFIDLATGKSTRKIVLPHKGATREPFVAIAPDQKTLVFSFPEQVQNLAQEFVVWDLAKDKLKTSFSIAIDQGFGRPPFAVSPDGRWLALSIIKQAGAKRQRNAETYLEIWDLHQGKAVRKIETDLRTQKLAFSPDGKSLAACNDQSTLRIYEVATGLEKHSIRLRRAQTSLLKFSPDGASLYLANVYGQVSRWNVASGERLASFDAPEQRPVSQLAFQEDGKVLAFAVGHDAAHLWDLATGKRHSPEGVPASIITNLQFTPKGELFVSAEDGHAAWWDPRKPSKLRDLKLDFYDRDPDTSAAGPMGFLAPKLDGGAVTLTADGALAAWTEGGAIAVFDAKTGKHLYDDDNESVDLAAVCMIDQGKKFATIRHKTVRVWNARTGRDLHKFELPFADEERPTKLVATTTGSHFAVAAVSQQGQSRVLLWDAAQSKVVREWTGAEQIEVLRFSPDDQWLAMGGRSGEGGADSVRLARVGAARGDFRLPLFKADSEITQLAFAPDGRQLACAALVPGPGIRDAGKICIYELASKKIRLELVGHPTGVIEQLAYSHDAALLASGASDTTALIWSAGLRAFADKPGKPLTEDETLGEFQKLAGADAKIAFQGMIKLAQAPAPTVKSLDWRIEPAKKPDSGPKTAAQWIQDLSSGQFAVRARANDMLKKLGPAAEADLREALPKVKDLETRRRVEELLERIIGQEWTAEEVMHARAVEVLEAIATPEARAVLTRWASGDPAAILTIGARQALARLRGS